MTKVLFLCVHNSARSQMAEAFLKQYGAGAFLAESAGLEPGKLNSYAVRAMAEVGIDISDNTTKSVFDLRAQGRTYDVVVTVCSKEAAERCPVSEEEIMSRVRQVRDQIEDAVKKFVASHR